MFTQFVNLKKSVIFYRFRKQAIYTLDNYIYAMVLDAEEIEEILAAHEKYDGDLSQILKAVSRPRRTVIKYLKLNKKPFYNSNTWKCDADTIARIEKEHGPSNGIARIAARNLKDVSYYSVLKYWRKAELPIRTRGGNTRDLEAKL